MTVSLFDEEVRFCPSCDGYVRYLRSPTDCYCVECGGVAALLSPTDLKKVRGTSGKSKSTSDGPGRWNDAGDMPVRGFSG